MTRKAVIGPQSGSGVLSTSAGTDYYFPTLTADVTMQISDAGAGDGDEFNITNDSTTFRVILVPVSGIGFFGGLKNASTYYRRLRLKRIAGTWYTLDSEYVT